MSQELKTIVACDSLLGPVPYFVFFYGILFVDMINLPFQWTKLVLKSYDTSSKAEMTYHRIKTPQAQ